MRLPMLDTRSWILARNVAGIALLLQVSSIQYPASAASTGASFLKIGTGARAVGLGSAYTAVADDADSMYWNPAGLARLSEAQLTATHAQWFSDLRYDSVGVAVPVLLWSVGGGITHFSQGDLQGRDVVGNRQSDFRASDMAAFVSIARILRPGVGVGVNAKYIRQSIGAQNASGVAFDAGSQVILSRRLAVGLSVQNAGPRMRYLKEDYRLPLAVSGGIAYSPFSRMTVSADLRRDVYERKTSLSVGSEFCALGSVILRAGYSGFMGSVGASPGSSGEGAGARGNFLGMGLGIGFKLFGSQMDYAMVPYGELGDTHRLSLNYKF